MTGEREQRRAMALLPSPPLAEHQRLHLRPKEKSKGKDKQPAPKFIRHDTEPGQHGWQVGRGLLERGGNDSGSQEDGSSRGERRCHCAETIDGWSIHAVGDERRGVLH